MSDLIDWERKRPRATYALIRGRGDPVQVLIAEDEESIGQTIALHVIAPTSPQELGSCLQEIRSALLDHRWADAVATWIDATGHVVDVYPDEPIWGSASEEDLIDFEIQFMPIFDDPGA